MGSKPASINSKKHTDLPSFNEEAIQMLQVVGAALMILWLALPLVAFAANARRRKPLHPFFLLALTTAVGFALLGAAAWASEAHLKAEMNRFDLDGDGGIGGPELTPDAQKALDEWASDTGRTMVVFTGIPLSALWAGAWFAVFFTAKWLLAAVISARARRHPADSR